MSQQNSQTPRDFLRALERKFGVKITFDLACTTHDCVAPVRDGEIRHLGTSGKIEVNYDVTSGYYHNFGIDALKENWHEIPQPLQDDGKESVGFLNNPWKQTFRYAAKCNAHSKGKFILGSSREGDDPSDYEFEPGIRIFSLWPAGVGTNWFRQYVHGQADVYFLSPRLVYTDPRTGLPFVQVYPKNHAKAGMPKERLNKQTGQVEHIPQTGLNDAILCDWGGAGDTFCWNWQETLDEAAAAR